MSVFIIRTWWCRTHCGINLGDILFVGMVEIDEIVSNNPSKLMTIFKYLSENIQSQSSAIPLMGAASLDAGGCIGRLRCFVLM